MSEDVPASPLPASSPSSAPDDCRLYVPDFDNWKAAIKTNWDKTYCFAKNPGEDYYHLVLNGEIFLKRGDEVLCLRCALRQGVVTTNRLFWQSRSGSDRRIDF